ncbi:hypothetical protein FOMPIDRAFT_1055528 [Fomitopsis schrenkii]|uniref:RING-type domain-containing protein n=1 Tax=Fomitopsis schrenkii TaxID=2126942 RepID=S8EWB3_FOMSC|nr:hypothetical protein FOMPIDRAFT_1055528 [Fomitopsis schrenkii]
MFARCTICLDTLGEGNPPLSTACGHLYCTRCAGRYFAFEAPCATCRAGPYKLDQLIKLFPDYENESDRPPSPPVSDGGLAVAASTNPALTATALDRAIAELIAPLSGLGLGGDRPSLPGSYGPASSAPPWRRPRPPPVSDPLASYMKRARSIAEQNARRAERRRASSSLNQMQIMLPTSRARHAARGRLAPEQEFEILGDFGKPQRPYHDP